MLLHQPTKTLGNVPRISAVQTTESFFLRPGATVAYSYQTLQVSIRLNCYKYYPFISPIIWATTTSKICGPSACTLAFRQQARQSCQTSHRISTARKYRIQAKCTSVIHPHMSYVFLQRLAVPCFLQLLNPEDDSTRIIRNVDHCLSNDTA